MTDANLIWILWAALIVVTIFCAVGYHIINEKESEIESLKNRLNPWKKKPKRKK